LIAAGALLKRRKITEFLWLVFLAHSALTSVRHAPLYASIAAPLLASELTFWWRDWVSGKKKSSFAAIFYQLGEDLTPSFRRTTFWPALVLVVVAAIGTPMHWPTDFPKEAFPVEMVHQNAGLLASGPLLAPDQWGDYLIYSYYPK